MALGVCLGGDLMLDALNYRMRSGSGWLGLRWMIRLWCVSCLDSRGATPVDLSVVLLHSFTHGKYSRGMW